MKRIIMVGAAVIAVAASGFAFSDDGDGKFREEMNGFKEAPQIVLTSGTGTFEATISRDGSAIDYVLTFQNLESDARQAHIHLGWPQSNGSVVLWLCDSDGPGLPASPVASTPLCSQNSAAGDIKNGRVEGALTAADLVAVAANGIAGSADFDEVVDAIRAGRRPARSPAATSRSITTKIGEAHLTQTAATGPYNGAVAAVLALPSRAHRAVPTASAGFSPVIS